MKDVHTVFCCHYFAVNWIQFLLFFFFFVCNRIQSKVTMHAPLSILYIQSSFRLCFSHSPLILFVAAFLLLLLLLLLRCPSCRCLFLLLLFRNFMDLDLCLFVFVDLVFFIFILVVFSFWFWLLLAKQRNYPTFFTRRATTLSTQSDRPFSSVLFLWTVQLGTVLVFTILSLSLSLSLSIGSMSQMY